MKKINVCGADDKNLFKLTDDEVTFLWEVDKDNPRVEVEFEEV